MLAYLCFDFHHRVKGDVILDLLRGCFGVGINPGGIQILVVCVFDMIVTGLTFPGAGRLPVTGLEVIHIHRIGREIMVAFHHFG